MYAQLHELMSFDSHLYIKRVSCRYNSNLFSVPNTHCFCFYLQRHSLMSSWLKCNMQELDEHLICFGQI